MQCKVHMCPEHVQDVSRMHAKNVWNAHKTRGPVQVQNLAINLQEDLINCYTLFHQTRETSHVRGMFWTCANVTLNFSCTTHTYMTR